MDEERKDRGKMVSGSHESIADVIWRSILIIIICTSLNVAIAFLMPSWIIPTGCFLVGWYGCAAYDWMKP